jgi:large subunit ribosomal protein L21
MYAILQHGGHQYRVASGDRILVDRIPVEVGSTVTLESVLLIGDGAETDVAKGSPVEASVTATVVAHRRGRKIRVFTYKPKKRRRRTLGYRSQLTELRIDEVARGKPEAKPKPATKPRRAAPHAEEAPESMSAETAAAAAPAVTERAVEAATPEAAAQPAPEASAPDGPATETAAAGEPAAEKPAPKRRAPRPKKEPSDGA